MMSTSETLQALQIAAITLASLSGLFGVYFVLFVLAIWSTYQQETVSSKRLRWVTVALFLDLLAHFITRSLEFSRARLQNDSDEEILHWTIPLLVVGKYVTMSRSLLRVLTHAAASITTTLAGFLSDGTLAWRFYIIFDRKRWSLFLPAVSVLMNALLCWSADAQHLAIYFNRSFYESTLLPVTLKITVAWGWFMFAINTAMTGAILWKIMWTAHSVHDAMFEHDHKMDMVRKHSSTLRAVIDSALVTWVGIIVYEVASLAPTGHVTTDLNVGYVMLNIIPVFFGISQSLITARLGLSRELFTHPCTRHFMV
ncbi:hypothetical protein BC834DRAFT_34725 [Gloeopeniophorella convolvens]|nr:hypothetical protein BC834DRAFT_34725 [Gloeopeniophorella convolvens]